MNALHGFVFLVILIRKILFSLVRNFSYEFARLKGQDQIKELINVINVEVFRGKKTFF